MRDSKEIYQTISETFDQICAGNLHEKESDPPTPGEVAAAHDRHMETVRPLSQRKRAERLPSGEVHWIDPPKDKEGKPILDYGSDDGSGEYEYHFDPSSDEPGERELSKTKSAWLRGGRVSFDASDPGAATRGGPTDEKINPWLEGPHKVDIPEWQKKLGHKTPEETVGWFQQRAYDQYNVTPPGEHGHQIDAETGEKIYPTWGPEESRRRAAGREEAMKQVGHVGLDLAMITPGPWQVPAAAAQTAWYGAEGKPGQAALSSLPLIPGKAASAAIRGAGRVTRRAAGGRLEDLGVKVGGADWVQKVPGLRGAATVISPRAAAASNIRGADTSLRTAIGRSPSEFGIDPTLRMSQRPTSVFAPSMSNDEITNAIVAARQKLGALSGTSPTATRKNIEAAIAQLEKAAANRGSDVSSRAAELARGLGDISGKGLRSRAFTGGEQTLFGGKPRMTSKGFPTRTQLRTSPSTPSVWTTGRSTAIAGRPGVEPEQRVGVPGVMPGAITSELEAPVETAKRAGKAGLEVLKSYGVPLKWFQKQLDVKTPGDVLQKVGELGIDKEHQQK